MKFTNKQNGNATTVGLILLVVWLVAIVGWVKNIIELCHAGPSFGGMEIARVIGVFMAPLGAVLGYF